MLKHVAILILFAACSRFVAYTDESYNQVASVKTGATKGDILFSHNINGELQPCGCRKFPLGGIEQAAGHFHQERELGPVIYVDTGDLFFPSPVIPPNVQDSHRYTADTLVEGMEKLGLNFFVPGDQDFALGLAWLAGVSKRAHFTFLIANLRAGSSIQAKAWARVVVGERTIILIGVLDPTLVPQEYAQEFTSPQDAIKRALQEANPDPKDLVVLLSHSGMEEDQKIARLFPRLNWIVGAHSQSYTMRPTEEGDTRLVQVLSRNHFIGRIRFGLGRNDTQDSFDLLETREEMAQVVQPNPLSPLMAKWREGIKQVQADEQAKMAGDVVPDPLPTFNSCLECHQKQHDYWQGTAHALAWTTLQQKGADNNPACVGCHSLGWQHPQGFSATPQRVRFKTGGDAAALKAYSTALHASFKNIKSVRGLKPAERRVAAQKWEKIMAQHEVTHDYANVQCLNCHDKTRDHPFDGSMTHSGGPIGNKCLQCHTNDQSPDWYVAGKVDAKILATKIRSVACPRK